MGSEPIYWGIVLFALAGGCLLGWSWRGIRHQAMSQNWPVRWNLNARPVFSVHERTLYRELRAALPQHVVLAKVGLLRFCQAADEWDARQWYERLQPLHVGILICTPNGVAVSAIDLEQRQNSSGRRAQRLKEATLEACRVRYMRCQPGQWPQPSLLAGWALGQSGAPHGATSDEHVSSQADMLHDAGDLLARKLRERRAERAARWAESSFSQDSFFAFDTRFDGAANSIPAPLESEQVAAASRARDAAPARSAGGGIKPR